MDEHISSCIVVYITVIDLIHSLRAEKFLRRLTRYLVTAEGGGAWARVLRLDNA